MKTFLRQCLLLLTLSVCLLSSDVARFTVFAQAITTINVSGTVVTPSVKRLGINMGTLTYYDAGQYLKQLVTHNVGFEPQLNQSVDRCFSGTATTCVGDPFTGWPSGFWNSATFEVITGAAKGRSGTILSSTAAGGGNGMQYQFSDSGTAPAEGDYIVLRKTNPDGQTALTGWFSPTSPGVEIAIETADLPPGQGRQAVRMTKTDASQNATIQSFIDTNTGLTFLQLNGRYRLSFMAKALAGSTVSVNVRRLTSGNPVFVNQTVTLSNTWAPYSVDFTAAENGSQVGSIAVAFSLPNPASVLLDNVSLTQTDGDPTNTTAFTDSLVRTLTELNPGLLRYWDYQLGDSLDNQIAPYFERARSGYHAFTPDTETLQVGLHEFLELCEHVHAEPWYVFPITFSAQEMTNLLEYLGGPATTPYGAKRAARGHSAPWTAAFSKIHLEFGNESWNSIFKGGAIEYPVSYGNRGGELFGVAKSSPYYSSSKFDLVLGGQSVFIGRNSDIHAASANHDSLAVAPYIGMTVDSFATTEELFGPLFAEVESVNQTGYMRQNIDMLRSSTRPVPLSIYEVNLHTTEGSISQAALDSFAPSLGAGLAVADHMLMMLRDLKIKDQMLFNLPNYQFQRADGKLVHLWGVVRDMGVTNRKRPQYLAMKLANEAIAGDLVATTHSGDNPTWNQPLLNQVQLNNAHYIQSYAFSSGGSRSLVVFNLHRSSSLAVNFSGVNAPVGTVTLKRLTSAAITDTNEDAENVKVTSQTLSNFSPSQPLSLPPFSMTVLQWQVAAPTPTFSFTVSDRGGASLTTTGTLPSTAVGYARIQPGSASTAPAGLAIFGFRQNDVLVTEAGVPASAPIRSGRIYADINSPVNTGLAMANPNNQDAVVSFFFTGENGNSSTRTTTIPANGQIAAFLDQSPFNASAPFNGAFTFDSSVPVAVIALRGLTNERGEFLITTLPVADLNAPAAVGTIVFPHFADGGGWATQIVLVNPTDSIMTGTAQFLGSSGGDAALIVNGQSASSFAYSIPARSSRKLQTSGAGSNIVSGSVRVVPAAGVPPPSGVAIFSYRNGNITVSEAGVPAVPAGTAFRLYAEASGSIQTGIAVSNLSLNAATITLELSRLDGSSTAQTGTLTVPGNGQTALFLNQVPGLGSLPIPFQGVLRVSSTASISVAGLRGRYNERNDFLITTTPPANEAAPASTAPLFFPHIVDSGGYTTQFILFSGQAGQSSSGAIQFLSQTGGTWNGTLP